MYCRFGRRIRYLRVSVTDRCNLRCYYCLPSDRPPPMPCDDLLSLEEIADLCRVAADLGCDKVRLTGGEPLMRADIVALVSGLRRIARLKELCMTTNGVLLERYAGPLRRGGLDRLNVSLDAVRPECYRAKTGGGDVQRVLAGIRAAQAAGFERIKLNCVVEKSADEPDARDVAAFARQWGLEARFIRRMNLATGEFWVVERGGGGDCMRCNRLRVDSNGLVRPCLFSDAGFSVRKLGAREALLRAAAAKPASGERCFTSTFSRIGG